MDGMMKKTAGKRAAAVVGVLKSLKTIFKTLRRPRVSQSHPNNLEPVFWG